MILWRIMAVLVLEQASRQRRKRKTSSWQLSSKQVNPKKPQCQLCASTPQRRPNGPVILKQTENQGSQNSIKPPTKITACQLEPDNNPNYCLGLLWNIVVCTTLFTICQLYLKLQIYSRHLPLQTWSAKRLSFHNINPLVYTRNGYLRSSFKTEKSEISFYNKTLQCILTAFTTSLIHSCAHSDTWWNAKTKLWKIPTWWLSRADPNPEITASGARNCPTPPWPQRSLLNWKNCKWSLYVKVHMRLRGLDYSW